MDFTLIKDIPYGEHERHRFDLFVPENIKTPNGIILYIHGGGWHSGSKEVHHADCEHFCRLGYVCASMNYRYVSDEINVSDELDDITEALKTMKTECEKYGMDAEKVILSGGSAGAHLALLYAYTRSSEASLAPVAVCAYCPPVDCAAGDFLLGISGEFEDWKYDILSKCCGVKITKNDFCDSLQQQALKKISPKEYLSEKCVPITVFHGRHDELVPFEHIVSFVSMLEKYGIENDFLIYENSGHAQDKDPETALQAKNIIKKYAERYL